MMTYAVCIPMLPNMSNANRKEMQHPHKDHLLLSRICMDAVLGEEGYLETFLNFSYIQNFSDAEGDFIEHKNVGVSYHSRFFSPIQYSNPLTIQIKIIFIDAKNYTEQGGEKTVIAGLLEIKEEASVTGLPPSINQTSNTASIVAGVKDDLLS